MVAGFVAEFRNGCILKWLLCAGLCRGWLAAHVCDCVADAKLGVTSGVCVGTGTFSTGISKTSGTVIGRGGVGKRMPNSCWMVSLASVEEASGRDEG
jgi:hypothetical protein